MYLSVYFVAGSGVTEVRCYFHELADAQTSGDGKVNPLKVSGRSPRLHVKVVGAGGPCEVRGAARAGSDFVNFMVQTNVLIIMPFAFTTTMYRFPRRDVQRTYHLHGTNKGYGGFLCVTAKLTLLKKRCELHKMVIFKGDYYLQHSAFVYLLSILCDFGEYLPSLTEETTSPNEMEIMPYRESGATVCCSPDQFPRGQPRYRWYDDGVILLE